MSPAAHPSLPTGRCRPRDNPFRSGRVDTLSFHGPPAPETIDRFESMGRVGALVGPCGTGKSTHLRALHEELARRGATIVSWTLRAEEAPPDRRAIARAGTTFSRATIWSIDGAEQLGRFAWRAVRRAARHAAGLLITTHAAGRLPILHRHDPDEIRAIELAALLDPSLLDPTRLDRAQGRTRVIELHRAHAGNLRTVFEELYLDRAIGRSER